jgi:transcriptional regulator with XRE-family HTH domain
MDQIRRLREEKGMSQAKLAVLADMNPATLWRYETGQRSPNVDQLERLAGVLEIEVSDFFPKAQSPLSLEERTTSVFEDAIAIAAGKWLEDLDELEQKISAEPADKTLFERSEALSYSIVGRELLRGLLPHALLDENVSREDVEKAADEADRMPKDQREGVGRLVHLLLRVSNKAHNVWEIGKEEREHSDAS